MQWHCDQKCLWPITCISIIALPILLSVIAVLWGINAFRSNFAVRHDDRDLVLLSNVFWDIYSVISSLQVLNTNGSVRGNDCDVGTRAPNLQMNWKSTIKFVDDKQKYKHIKGKLLANQKYLFLGLVRFSCDHIYEFWPVWFSHNPNGNQGHIGLLKNNDKTLE